MDNISINYLFWNLCNISVMFESDVLSPNRFKGCLVEFFLFNPRNYYKLSLCATFSNTFDNL